ncbi:type II toxin-antitoxin system VapC family toxin [Thiorhodococcus mannitoliphagus]|uniref:Ribonuclease VapC n=1 Tax=Thiorhodococcus mannitoliphagus TaxID=329406 RepID=A0A6P1DN87_9GAMM|nr:type II toxin-antitoxin system VapC family toxin [Thiorhodococcus mannitoliphagus]NEX19399.1 type II toxin-antitoxin system VapC family toxin [Thiorhodococcus mannitoliphagus]
MGYLIDTNIWSELQKGDRTNPGVRRWYETVHARELYFSVLVIGEVRCGIERLRRRDAPQAERLEPRLAELSAKVSARILPISTPIAERWGRINVPDPLPVVDGLLAATALEHDLVLVTRNVRDVERTEVRLLNPFEEATG